MDINTITRLVKATGVAPGELILVHFWGEDGDKEIANRFTAAVAAQGASPVLLQQSRTINQALFAGAGETCFGEAYFDLLSHFDAVLDVFAYQPIVLGGTLPKDQMGYYRNYISGLFSRLMKCKRFTQIRVPTAANAAESDLEPEAYIRRMEAAYDVDYEAMKLACQQAVVPYQDAAEVTLHTGKDQVLRLKLAGRQWHLDAGDGDLPCGEVYIAPVEGESNGTVFFRRLFLEGAVYENVTMTIQEGKLCHCSEEVVMAWFEKLPEENRVLCELGLGMNPQVTELCGYRLLDEKMAGTFHIAFGANQMFGGSNAASDHIDFVGYGTLEVVL